MFAHAEDGSRKLLALLKWSPVALQVATAGAMGSAYLALCERLLLDESKALGSELWIGWASLIFLLTAYWLPYALASAALMKVVTFLLNIGSHRPRQQRWARDRSTAGCALSLFDLQDDAHEEMDDVVPCSSIQNAFDGTTNQPVMLANYLAADHANWVTFRGTQISPMETAVVAWMRVHWFYGASCALCTDAAWQVSQEMMEE
jgi:hypothetical protein